jgi:hypothetical protein
MELTTLGHHEEVINRNLEALSQIAISLRAIRDGELYMQAGYSSFAEYVSGRWNRTDRWARMVIEAPVTVAALSEHLPDDVPPPGQLSHINALAAVEPEQAADAWVAAVEEHGEPTVPQVKAKVREASAAAPPAEPPVRSVPESEVTVCVLDRLKRIVPGLIAIVFGHSGEFRDMLRDASDLKASLRKLARTQHGRAVRLNELERCLAEFARGLEGAEPWTSCPRCRTKIYPACELCSGRGWITRNQYGTAITEGDKEWLAQEQ